MQWQCVKDLYLKPPMVVALFKTKFMRDVTVCPKGMAIADNEKTIISKTVRNLDSVIDSG